MKINPSKILVLLLILLPALVHAEEEEVNCGGYNSETQSYVYGVCRDESFDGWDSTTKAYVYGRCEAGEDLVAYDHQTNATVHGICGSR